MGESALDVIEMKIAAVVEEFVIASEDYESSIATLRAEYAMYGGTDLVIEALLALR